MGNTVSSSGEEEIPAGNPASDAPSAGICASATASGNKTAACDATREEEARAAGNSSTFPAVANSGMGGKETAASDAADRGDEPATRSGSGTSTAAASGVIKKMTVRMMQADVDLILAYTPTLLPTLPGMDHLPDRLQNTITDAIIDAACVLQQSQESGLREHEWERRQMEVKGYVDFVIKVYDDGAEMEEEGAEAVLRRRGRRRFRPGVRLAGGTVKRVN